MFTGRDEEEVVALGRRFRDTVLARGGGQHPMEVFEVICARTCMYT
jgi:oligopeptidase A